VASRVANDSLSVGVSDHGGWAIFVTVTAEGTLVDRRRVELVNDELPKLPHHHDAQGLPAGEGVALVERVRRSAEVTSKARLDELEAALKGRVDRIALRARQPLPPTVAERISDYRASNVADWVMYREALAQAAAARGWLVHWYDAKHVFSDAARALGRKTIDDLLEKTGATIGPPWQKDQRLAMAAAISATAAKGVSS
jgi:hypothetical protein